jgi:hypothetical protein
MPAQWHRCFSCTKVKADTRIYLQKGKTIRYCKACSFKFTDIKPKINQRVPERFK